MSLEKMEETLNTLTTLNDKQDGDLVKADDWNRLIAGVEVIGKELVTLIKQVESVEAYVGYEAGSTTSLRQRIAALEEHVGQKTDVSSAPTLTGRVRRLEDFRLYVEPLLDQYIVELSTDEEKHLLGEAATLTATVKKPDGSPPATRPWIDFIATWGRLSAFQGFEARQGTGDRSISVRTDAHGIAKVTVSAEQNAKLDVEAEQNIAALFQQSLPTEPITFSKAVLAAKTTDDEHMDLVYGVVTNEYESRKDALKNLADVYYAGVAGGLLGGLRPQIRWQDYRSIVVAFAKNDSDPTTPDRNRGLGSIQITFRDWLGPWIYKYFDDDSKLVDRLVDTIKHGLSPDVSKTFDNIHAELVGVLGECGIVGRQKTLNALTKAADIVDDATMPGYEMKIKEAVKNAAFMQKSLELPQGMGAPAGALAPGSQAMSAMFGQAKQIAGVDGRVSQMDLKIAQETDQAVTARMKEMVIPGGAMDGMKKEIGSLRAQVTNLMQIGDVSTVQARLQKVEDVSLRLDKFIAAKG